MTCYLKAKSIFDTAKQFDLACRQIGLVGIPSIVTNVFATELYLKCMIMLEDNNIPKTHALDTLFEILNKESKSEIEENWDNDSKNKIVFGALKFQLKHEVDQNLIINLRKSRNTFEQMRYFYEKPPNDFFISELPRILRKLIVGRMPSWRDKTGDSLD